MDVGIYGGIKKIFCSGCKMGCNYFHAAVFPLDILFNFYRITNIKAQMLENKKSFFRKDFTPCLVGCPILYSNF